MIFLLATARSPAFINSISAYTLPMSLTLYYKITKDKTMYRLNQQAGAILMTAFQNWAEGSGQPLV
jgi:hypothetical protein